MAAKPKKHLTGPEMSALSGPLTAAQTALAQASFFIAARVANAAWGVLGHITAELLVKDIFANRPGGADALERLQEALHDYSPGNWPLPLTTKERVTAVLEELYAEAEQQPTREAVLETLYQAICKAHEA